MTTTRFRRAALLVIATVGAAACGGDKGGNVTGPPPAQKQLSKASGDNQQGTPGSAAPAALTVSIRDGAAGIAGEPVAWRVLLGGGQLSDDTVFTDADGAASVTLTLGGSVGGNIVRAVWPGHDSTTFHVTGTGSFTVTGGGNNVPERYTSDLWLTDGYAYTGTWGGALRPPGTPGNAVKIWRLDGNGAPVLADSIITPNIATVSDIQVSDDGKWLAYTTEYGSTGARGLYVYELVTP
ncbi:MAG TPA: hypothetical protein VG692_14735, partial [Gemmatimonadales bacterium]|nr:hypothetical protein [Gemmatimonadales bacterium]